LSNQRTVQAVSISPEGEEGSFSHGNEMQVISMVKDVSFYENKILFNIFP